MSRTYQKFLSRSYSVLDRRRNHSFRVKERRCIQDELYKPEHGEVMFPRYYGVCKGWFIFKRRCQSKKEIRGRYFTEARNILNGYRKKRYRTECEDYQKSFFDAFNRIKSGVCPDGKESRFEWLNTREAKKAVKNWGGNPLEVLYYLGYEGIIEKAVSNECKRMSKK